MEEKKKDESKEKKERITVIDEGIDLIDMAGTRGGCCVTPFIAIR